MSNQAQNRPRSSTLANTISFTHTRNNNANATSNAHNEPQNSVSVSGSLQYLNRNNSSSTLHSITKTLSTVGFTPMTPLDTSHPRRSSGSSTSVNALPSSAASGNGVTSTMASSGPTSSVSPLPSTGTKIENAFLRARLYARIKAKDLKRGAKSAEEKHHSHHKFLKKNAHSGLSSAQSNSKLETGSTLYSFDPSTILDNDVVMKHVINESNVKSLSFEEKDQMADNLWATVTKAVIMLFKVDNQNSLKLKTPVEDINRMLTVYLMLRLENNSTTTSIISEIMEFLRDGMNILENELSFDESLSENGGEFLRISITWNYFFKHIYHYLLGVLLPLELEINKPSKGNRNWGEEFVDMKLSTKNLVLVAFRDFVVLPYFESEIMIPAEIEFEERKRLVQCFGMLQTIQSTSYNQKIIEHVLMLLLQELGSL